MLGICFDMHWRTKSVDPDAPRISDREYMILSTLLGSVRTGLYGLEIRDAIRAEFGKDVGLGSMYVTLGRLVEKGLVRRLEGELARHCEDLRRQYYAISESGGEAVRAKQQGLGVLLAPASVVPK